MYGVTTAADACGDIEVAAAVVVVVVRAVVTPGARGVVVADVGVVVVVTVTVTVVAEGAMDMVGPIKDEVSQCPPPSLGGKETIGPEVVRLWDTALMAGELSPLGMEAKESCCWMVPLVVVPVLVFSRSCKLCFAHTELLFIDNAVSTSLSFFFFLFDFDLFLLGSMIFCPLCTVATYSF